MSGEARKSLPSRPGSQPLHRDAHGGGLGGGGWSGGATLGLGKSLRLLLEFFGTPPCKKQRSGRQRRY